MACNIKRIPEEIKIILDYPYLTAEETPVHFFPLLSYAEVREMQVQVLGEEGEEREASADEAVFRWWKAHVLEKTRKQYEGVGEDWHEELWAHPRARWHIIHATRGYFQAMTPRSFLG